MKQKFYFRHELFLHKFSEGKKNSRSVLSECIRLNGLAQSISEMYDIIKFLRSNIAWRVNETIEVHSAVFGGLIGREHADSIGGCNW